MSGANYINGAYDYAKELQWKLQIGSKMIPEYPCRSLAETFYQLKKALGIAGSAFHSVDLTPAKYMNDHFIIGVDCEKVLDASWTGLNTRAGDLMLVRKKKEPLEIDQRLGKCDIHDLTHRPDLRNS